MKQQTGTSTSHHIAIYVPAINALNILSSVLHESVIRIKHKKKYAHTLIIFVIHTIIPAVSLCSDEF